jgi:hypothetical protein
MSGNQPLAQAEMEIVPLNEWTEGKDFCFRCNFYVVMRGHEERCRIPNLKDVNMVESSGAWSATKAKAWLGDAVHRLDVQVVAMLINLNDKEKGQFVNDQCSGEFQANWLKYHENCHNDGRSDKTLSTHFEANYKHLREEYLHHLLEGYGKSQIDVDIYLTSLY